MHPRIPLAFLAARGHCWLMVNLSSTRTPRSLSAELLSSRSAPSLSWCMGLFLPRCRTLHLPLLSFIRFLCAQLSSLSRFRWMAAQPSGVSTTPPSFVSSANLLRVHFVLLSRSLMNELNKTGPSTEAWSKISAFQLALLDKLEWLVLSLRYLSLNHRITESQNSRGWKGPLWVI